MSLLDAPAEAPPVPLVPLSVRVAWAAGCCLVAASALTFGVLAIEQLHSLADGDLDALAADRMGTTLLIFAAAALPGLVIGFAATRAVRGQPVARAVAWVVAPVAGWFFLAGFGWTVLVVRDRPLGVPLGLVSALGAPAGLVLTAVVAVALATPSAREHVRAAHGRGHTGPASPAVGYAVLATTRRMLVLAVLLELAAVACWVAVSARVATTHLDLVTLPALVVTVLGTVPPAVALGCTVLVLRLRDWSLRTAAFVTGVLAVGAAVPASFYLMAPLFALLDQRESAPAGAVPLAKLGVVLPPVALLLLAAALILLGTPSASAWIGDRDQPAPGPAPSAINSG